MKKGIRLLTYARKAPPNLPTYLDSRLDSNWKERQGLPWCPHIAWIYFKNVTFQKSDYLVYFYAPVFFLCGSCHSFRYFFNWGNFLESTMYNFWSYAIYFETIFFTCFIALSWYIIAHASYLVVYENLANKNPVLLISHFGKESVQCGIGWRSLFTAKNSREY